MRAPRRLPLSVPGLLLFLAVLLAPVASSRATDGLYRVDTPDFSVVDDALPLTDCTATHP